MKIAYNWLKEYINLSESPQEIAQLLTQRGLEVTNIAPFEPIKGGLKGLLIGQVITCEKHPNADQLKKTWVDVGTSTHLTIICGASNVQAGQKVVIAPVGTKLYNTQGISLKIKKTKIRGEISEGMICAEDEIGLGDSHEKIIVLDTALPPGTLVAQHFNIQTDNILELALTPNRADACAHIAIARELQAILDRPMQYPSVAKFKVDTPKLPIQVVAIDHHACPRYTGVTLSGVKVQASPAWLQNRLKSIDIRPINNIVDVTNFVLHELGQPLHAFDYDQIVGKKLWVKTNQASMPFVTLDDTTRILCGEELMICDQEGGLCIAGVLGGKRSSIHQDTQNIFLESAYFSPTTISKTLQHHAIKTEASFRYERGTDPNLTVYALKRACLLLKEITSCEVSSEIIDSYPQEMQALPVKVYYNNIVRLIGHSIPKENIKKILHNLAIAIKYETPEGFTAIVPPYRRDITREVDLIEEMVRIYGYDAIPITDKLGSTYLAPTTQPAKDKLENTIKVLLAANGYHEIYTNSLTKATYGAQTKTLNEQHAISILNPLSEALNVLRQTLLFSGLEVITYNINRKQANLKLFELGKIYRRQQAQYIEHNRLGIWLTGKIEALNWIRKPSEATFQTMNATIYQILHKLGITAFSCEPIQNHCYQESIQITFDQKPLLTAGKISQSLLNHMTISQPVFFADIDWDLLLQKIQPNKLYQKVSKFPAVQRDLSLVLDQSVTFQTIQSLIAQQNDKLIQAVVVFDVYKGEKLGTGKKAYTLRFTLQGKDKTLHDKLIDKVMTRLMHAFKTHLGAIIRT